MLRKPRILILDEATASLDSVTERSIMKTVNELTRGITTVIVAHRLSTIAHCDSIFVFEQGRVVESGTHEQLIKANGAYKKLWDAQQTESGIKELR